MVTKQRAEIKGVPYQLTQVEDGWRVQATQTKTDNFWRHYHVRTDPSGRPVSCTCPHHTHKAAHCKHMQAIEDRWLAEHPEAAAQMEQQAEAAGIAPAPTHRLVLGARTACFQAVGDLVHVRWFLRGEMTASATLPLSEGRARWLKLVNEGWSRF